MKGISIFKETILYAGTHRLHFDFAPTDSYYKAISKDVQINVRQATPIINWKNPADLTYGIVLSSSQLNASASVLGTFDRHSFSTLSSFFNLLKLTVTIIYEINTLKLRIYYLT
jgi:hypothetical protein